MSLLTDLQALSTTLIREFGESCTLFQVNATTYDPDTGTTSEDISAYNSYVVPEQYNANEIDGTLIQMSDIKALVASQAFIPKVGDALSFGSNQYRVISVQRSRLNGGDVLYTLQLRA